jgi:hypothetical protein
MAWITPKTDFAPGDVLTAAQMNNIGSDLTTLRGDFADYRYTGGNISLTGSTNWSNLTTIGTAGDLVLAAAAGDLVEMAVSMKVLNQAVNIGFDAVTVVSATVTNSFANNGAASAAYTNTQGISGWWAVASEYHGICGSAFYKLVAGDISSNTVTLRIRYAMAAATNRTLQANAGEPVQFWARNHGPVEI